MTKFKLLSTAIIASVMASCGQQLEVSCDFSAETVVGVAAFSGDDDNTVQRHFIEAITKHARTLGAGSSDFSVCSLTLPANARWRPARTRNYQDTNWTVFHGRSAISETEHDFAVWGAAPGGEYSDWLWFSTEDQDLYSPTDSAMTLSATDLDEEVDRGALWVVVAALEGRIETLPLEPRRAMAEALILEAVEQESTGWALDGHAEMAASLLYPSYLLSAETGEPVDSVSMSHGYIRHRDDGFLSSAASYRTALEFWPGGEHPAGLRQMLRGRTYYAHQEAENASDFQAVLELIDQREAILRAFEEETAREVALLDLQRTNVLADQAYALSDVAPLQSAINLLIELRARDIPEPDQFTVRDRLSDAFLARDLAIYSADAADWSKETTDGISEEVRFLELAIQAASDAHRDNSRSLSRDQRTQVLWLRARNYMRLADIRRDRQLLDRAEADFEVLSPRLEGLGSEDWLDDMQSLEGLRSELG